MSDRKRALETNGPEGSSHKKLKSDVIIILLNAILMYFYNLFCTPQTSSGSNGPTAPGGLPTDQLIAQKRAEIAAKLAAMKNMGKPGGAPGPTAARSASGLGVAAPVPKVPMVPTTVPSKVVLNATPSPSISGAPTPAAGSGSANSPASEELARRVAEAKRRVAEAQSKLAVKDNPYMALAAAASKKPHRGSGGGSSAVPSPGPGSTDPSQQGAGLKMAAHPLLLDVTPVLAQSKKDRYKPMQPKFASIKANVRNAPTPPPAPTPVAVPSPAANPYSAAAAAKDGPAGGCSGDWV
ncbi:hypothetical protein EST38_g2602 [Candolleomyces aberdarensis]|uniref:Uncharacterized protein n=1 Tax=Candolleomyces aberdarensis TaxID=2316362 RepID=A0A4Q2DV62_9AGAR|nr:hypothetical protein EST38_g2602 [Candolleomyces aberdarensis]